MQRDGEAVLQTLTAVWRGMRHLRKCGKRGNDLEEVERVSGTVRPPSGSSSLWRWVPQVTLRATQRLSIVGRLHRPAYRYETVYPRLKNHTNRTEVDACAGQTHRSAPTLTLLHRRFHGMPTRCRGGPVCPPETRQADIHGGIHTFSMIYLCLINHTNGTGVYAEGRRSCPTKDNRCVARNAPPAEIRQKRKRP